MGEGFPLWSLAPMAWEGREPLRDWIYLSVSLFPVSTPSPFPLYLEIHNSDWTETFAQIIFQKLAFLQPNKGINRLIRVPGGWGVPTWSGRGPLSCGHLGHCFALILPPENPKYSKIILRPFLSRLDSV